MSIDTSRTVTFSEAAWKLVLGILAGLVMVGLSVLVLSVTTYRGREVGPFLFPTLGAVGLVFFGFCVLALASRLLRQRGGTVTLGPQGILDVRIASDFVRWSAIQNISTWSTLGNDVMVLRVRPEVEKKLRLTPVARWTRGINARLGADGLCVAATGLEGDTARLLAVTEAYWKAHR